MYLINESFWISCSSLESRSVVDSDGVLHYAGLVSPALGQQLLMLRTPHDVHLHGLLVLLGLHILELLLVDLRPDHVTQRLQTLQLVTLTRHLEHSIDGASLKVNSQYSTNIISVVVNIGNISVTDI